MNNLTESGMPIVLQSTWQQYEKELAEAGDLVKTDKWVDENIRYIGSKNPNYKEFIRDTVALYPETDNHNKFALERLTAGYILLDREGPLPVLNKDKYEEAF